MQWNRLRVVISSTALMLFITLLMAGLQSCEKKENCTEKTWYQDQDNDGFGNSDQPRRECQQPSGFVADSSDCDDQNATIHPGAAEIDNDGIDQNCDGFDSRIWYRDRDGDGFGARNNNRRDGIQPAGYVGDSTDCDDNAANVHPGATEIPGNGIDEDCDGMDARNWWKDADGDGFGDPGIRSIANLRPSGFEDDSLDCDDRNAQIFPGAPEIAGNGIDEDCDGFDTQEWFLDLDNDTYGDDATRVVANTKPDNRYVSRGRDCSDNNAAVFPGAPEICDTLDNNCDGQNDEGFDTNKDTANCGSCGNVCPPGWKCVAGVCQP